MMLSLPKFKAIEISVLLVSHSPLPPVSPELPNTSFGKLHHILQSFTELLVRVRLGMSTWHTYQA